MRAYDVELAAADLRSCWLACSGVWARWVRRDRGGRSRRPGVPPRIPASAGALVWDREGRLLILKPTYKSGWTIPGGIVEADGETPWEACRRETREECGLELRHGELVCVDFLRPRPGRPGGMRFLFTVARSIGRPLPASFCRRRRSLTTGWLVSTVLFACSAGQYAGASPRPPGSPDDCATSKTDARFANRAPCPRLGGAA
jgi:ADP-ribose pyrophosphatase YjhB (NUDIX family)